MPLATVFLHLASQSGSGSGAFWYQTDPLFLVPDRFRHRYGLKARQSGIPPLKKHKKLKIVWVGANNGMGIFTISQLR
jgi:hypothetical protein